MYTVLTSTCTRTPFTDTRPTSDHPLPHPAAITNPQEKRHTINVTTSWTECTKASHHGDTETQTAKRKRSISNRIKMSPLHSRNFREGEGSNSFHHGRPLEHPETRPQESERTADKYNTSTGKQNHNGRRHTRHTPRPTSPLSHQITVEKTPTRVARGPYSQLTKQMTRCREGAEQNPSQHCKLTTKTENTLQESGRAAADVRHPSASEIHVK